MLGQRPGFPVCCDQAKKHEDGSQSNRCCRESELHFSRSIGTPASGLTAREFVSVYASSLNVLPRGVADRRGVRHRLDMTTTDPFEQSAQIVEAFAEAETDERVLDLLNRIAEALRDHAIDD